MAFVQGGLCEPIFFSNKVKCQDQNKSFHSFSFEENSNRDIYFIDPHLR